MQLLLDDDLVEGATFLCATRRHDIPSTSIRRFHQSREKAYSFLDPDERQEAFARVHQEFFQEWGLRAALDSGLARFQNLQQHLMAAAFRKARVRTEEGADLHVNPDARRRAIVALLPERMASTDRLDPFLNHELQHVSDMVDPAFEYDAEGVSAGASPSQQRLVRERYRLIWDVTIDGRLGRCGFATVATEAERSAEFERAFGFLADRSDRFVQLWEGDHPTHTEVLSLARDPRGFNNTRQIEPGAPCPLCGFATFQWIRAADISAVVLGRIRKDFKEWHEDEALCARCAEMYEATAMEGLPTTIEL